MLTYHTHIVWLFNFSSFTTETIEGFNVFRSSKSISLPIEEQNDQARKEVLLYTSVYFSGVAEAIGIGPTRPLVEMEHATWKQ